MALELDLATLFLFASDPSETSVLPEVAAFMAARMRLPPLVVLLGAPTSIGEWTLDRMGQLSKELGAPVVRAGDDGVSVGDLAGLMAEGLFQHGVIGYDASDLRAAFVPPCSGLVFRWAAWNGDAPAPVGLQLEQALLDPRVSRVFVTYRFPPGGSLMRLDEAIRRIESAVASSVPVTVSAPGFEGPEEAIVTVLALT